jgi:hypothetical protein
MINNLLPFSPLYKICCQARTASVSKSICSPGSPFPVCLCPSLAPVCPYPSLSVLCVDPKDSAMQSLHVTQSSTQPAVGSGPGLQTNQVGCLVSRTMGYMRGILPSGSVEMWAPFDDAHLPPGHCPILFYVAPSYKIRQAQV